MTFPRFNGFRRDTWWSRLLFSCLMIPAMAAYPLTNRLAGLLPVHYIWKFPLDDRVPLIKLFIIPYYAWYLLIAATAAWLVFTPHSGRLIYTMTLSISMTMVLANLFFLVLPTTIVRPAVIGDDVLSRMIRVIYAADRPFNLFPSLHVAVAVIISRCWYLAGPRRAWFHLLNFGILAMVCLSTIFTKQHYLPDIPGGIIAAWLGWQIGNWLSGQLFPVPQQSMPPGQAAAAPAWSEQDLPGDAKKP